MKQIIIEKRASYSEIASVFQKLNTKKYLLVYTSSAKRLPVWEYLLSLDIPRAEFCGFTPNPKYEDIKEGVALFKAEGCDTVLAIGGGSAIDVAKCIKLYCKMDDEKLYLEQEYTDTGIPLVAMPTTAGTGSESTPFSVIYYGGEKQSVKHASILPDVAILDPDVLETLPVYQKKCTVLDALCQAIESWWCVYSTDESKEYAKTAIEKIADNIYEYVNENTDRSRAEIMSAANLAGMAIAITATTAPHAMSYKLTTTYGLPHGHSTAISLPGVWKYMLLHPEKCTDKRGADYLFAVFEEIASAMGYKGSNNAWKAVEGFEKMLENFGIGYPSEIDKKEKAEYLADSVNVERLGNNPISLDHDALYTIYLEMLNNEA